MSDAFICDRCGDVNEGYGTQVRVGGCKSRTNDVFASSYSFSINAEFCESCYEGLIDVAETYVEDTDD